MSGRHAPRLPTDAELRVLKELAARTTGVGPHWWNGVRVSDMDDGGMGSLQLHLTDGVSPDESDFGREGGELRFTDADGIHVLVTLYLDKHGRPFEVDVWKTNFQPLLCFPESFPPD